MHNRKKKRNEKKNRNVAIKAAEEERKRRIEEEATKKANTEENPQTRKKGMSIEVTPAENTSTVASESQKDFKFVDQKV